MPTSQHKPAGPGSLPGTSPLLTISQVATLCETPWGLEGYSLLLEYNYLLLDVVGAGNQPGGDPLE